MVATDSGAWVLTPQEKGEVFLRAVIQGAKVESDAEAVWDGTIVTPPVKLDWSSGHQQDVVLDTTMNEKRRIPVVVTARVQKNVVREGEPIPLQVKIRNGLATAIDFATFSLKANNWNGETHGS